MKKLLHKTYKFSNSWTGTIIIVLFVIFFIAQAFKIPSGSMKDSLLIGDHLFAKKFAYGISMPHIPFIEQSIMPWSNSLRLVDGDTPLRGDIVIFRPPHNTKQHYVKRCVALPDDELFVLNKDLYIHHNEGDEWIKENFKDYEIIKKNGKSWVKNPYTKDHPGIHHDKKINADTPILITTNGNIQSIGFYTYMELKQNPAQLPAGTRVLPSLPIYNTEIIKVKKDNYFMMGDNRDHSNDSRFWGSVPYDNIEGTPWFIYFSVDKNWEIRWDRIGKTPTDLEEPIHLDLAKKERLKVDKDDHGIY